MPLGEVVGEFVGQAIMELGGQAISDRYGWKGCRNAILAVVSLIALTVWLFTD